MSAHALPPSRASTKALKKLMPILIVAYLVTYLDRINLSIVGKNISENIQLTPAAFGLASGLFYVGYLLFEIPSNVLLEKFGAKIWLTRIMVTWGLTTGLMVFVWNDTSLAIGRLLLGIAEAGFYPGVLLYLGYWFSKQARSQAWALFQVGIPLASIFGALATSLMLKLDGTGGLAGWRWVFIIEAVITVAMGLVLYLSLPNGPSDAQWLEPEERMAIAADVVSAKSDADGRGHDFSAFLVVFKNPVSWYCSVLMFCLATGFLGFTYWLPQLIGNRLQMGPVASGLLSSIPWLVAAVSLLLTIRYAGRLNSQTPLLACVSLLCFAGMVIAAVSNDAVIAFIGLCLVGTTQVVVPLQFNYSRSYFPAALAAVSLAMVNSIGNLGGFVGPVILGYLIEITGSQQNGLLALGCFYLVAAIMLMGAPAFISWARRLDMIPAIYHDERLENLS